MSANFGRRLPQKFAPVHRAVHRLVNAGIIGTEWTGSSKLNPNG